MDAGVASASANWFFMRGVYVNEITSKFSINASREMAPFGRYQHCADTKPSGIDCAIKVHLPSWTLLLTIYLEDPFVWKVRVDQCVVIDRKLCYMDGLPSRYFKGSVFDSSEQYGRECIAGAFA
ncbi:hypothetical protein CRG98_030618 [Punica granatum]|uniref:Uncharacterized protein n=1 Tax=Punica granatum TaxID=22663 RepID=A0A2I0IYI6_PUNGR|nr:hypothetical protein CRG98_030618 [Punica granatum]